VAYARDESPHVELALSAQSAMVDGVFVQTPGGGECAVVQFDADDVLTRGFRNFSERNLQLCHMPEVEADAAVLGTRALDHGQRFFERADHGERH
jgi:hypothetical protein